MGLRPPSRSSFRSADSVSTVMVVMTPGATQQQVDAVVARLETTGVHVVVMPGELTTAIGAIGDPAGVAELGLEVMPGVDRVVPKIGRASCRERVEKSVGGVS